MGACAFTGIQQRDVIVFKKTPFSSPSTRVQQNERKKLFVFKPKTDTCGRGLRACSHGGGGPQVGEVTRLSR